MRTATLLILATCLPLTLSAQEEPSSSPASMPASAPVSAPVIVQAAVCGNNEREPGEACDDGNTAEGDGCSSRCEVVFESKKKSKLLAFTLSAGLSAASIGLMFFDTNGAEEGTSGPLIGTLLLSVAPSAGQLYAGDVRHALGFSALRIASGGVFVVGFALVLGAAFNDDAGAGLGLLCLGVGALGTGGLVLYDIIDAPRSIARVQTRKLALQQKKTSVSLLPAPLRTATGDLAPGLSLGLRF